MKNVINLFEWSEYTEARLDNCKHMTKIEKKNRMICYLFETALQMCLDTRLNVSKSYDNELFLGVIAQDD